MASEFRHNSIANKMIHEFPTANPAETIESIQKRLMKESRFLKTIDYVYVVNKNNKLLGVVSIRELFVHKKSMRVDKVMRHDIISITPETDQEKAAHIALKHKIKSVPVVKKGKLIGIVTADSILSILNRSLNEDILHFAGIHKSHLEYENTMEVPVFASILHRIPWLIIGLIGIMLTAAFINIFEATLEKYLMLAFFIPAIVYMSDAIGTQHQTLFIRDIAILGKELNMPKYYARQMIIGLFLSILISIIVYGAVALFWKQYHIAFVISLSMFFTLIASSFSALFITSIIKKLGQDPALGSGPFATIISDLTSMIIYFAIASLML